MHFKYPGKIFIFIIGILLATQQACASCNGLSNSFRFQFNQGLSGRLTGSTVMVTTVESAVECFFVCANECHCLSFNYNISTGNEVTFNNCEILNSTKDERIIELQDDKNWRYYELVKNDICSGDFCDCHQSCYEHVRCQNYGEYIDDCSSAKRFKCICTKDFMGRFCENRIKTCRDYLNKGNGVYKITQTSTGDEMNVYCDFTSELNMAWTLLSSYSYKNNDIFKNAPLFIDLPINRTIPNWNAYRMSQTQMKDIRNGTTHWRATCDFNNGGVNYTDYFRQNLAVFDPLNVPVLPSHTKTLITCQQYEYFNVRGHQCINCTAGPFYESDDTAPHVLVSLSENMKCELVIKTSNLEQDFGYYGYRDTSHRCVTHENSTTQYWLGQFI